MDRQTRSRNSNLPSWALDSCGERSSSRIISTRESGSFRSPLFFVLIKQVLCRVVSVTVSSHRPTHQPHWKFSTIRGSHTRWRPNGETHKGTLPQPRVETECIGNSAMQRCDSQRRRSGTSTRSQLAIINFHSAVGGAGGSAWPWRRVLGYSVRVGTNAAGENIELPRVEADWSNERHNMRRRCLLPLGIPSCCARHQRV